MLSLFVIAGLLLFVVPGCIFGVAWLLRRV